MKREFFADENNKRCRRKQRSCTKDETLPYENENWNHRLRSCVIRIGAERVGESAGKIAKGEGECISYYIKEKNT